LDAWDSNPDNHSIVSVPRSLVLILWNQPRLVGV
jgi:hypothetical protein